MAVLLGEAFGYERDYKNATRYAKRWLAVTSQRDCVRIIERLRERAARLMQREAATVLNFTREI